MLTDAQIRSALAKARAANATIKLSEGRLQVRVRPSGASFFFRVQDGGRDRTMSLGQYPGLSLRAARDEAQKLDGLQSTGVDAIVRRRKEKKEQRAAEERELTQPTVADLFDRYFERHIRPRYKRPDEPRRIIETYIKPALGTARVEAVTRADLAALLERIAVRAPVMANRVLPILKRGFEFAADSGWIEHSPAARLTRLAAGGKERPRERALSLAELADVWALLQSESCRLDQRTRQVLRVLILTGQRLGEVLGMRWSDLDVELTTWTIPARAAKNGREHRVPVAAPLREILTVQRPLSTGDHIFQPLTARAIAKAVSRLLERKELHMEAWTPHDLRRTVVTQLNQMGVPPHVVEALVNHVTPGVQGVYNRADYWNERVSALAAWGERVERLNSNIIEFSPRACRAE